MCPLNTLGEESGYSTELIARPASTTVLPFSFSTMTNGLQFDWPSDHTGWRLQMNTAGLAFPGTWVTVLYSASTNQIWLPFDPAQGNVFFRPIYP